VSFLVLVLLLSGCGANSPVLPSDDGTTIEGVINEFCLAISNQDWDRARDCCVPYSEAYDALSQYEALANNVFQDYGNVKINCQLTISKVLENGNYATAEVKGTLLASVGIFGETQDLAGNISSQRIDHRWYISAIEW